LQTGHTILIALLCWQAAASAPLPSLATFRPHIIAVGLTGGYQVAAVDLNRDHRPDLIALASGLNELAWYENPHWSRHVIASGLRSAVNLAAADLDGDGIPEIVLASEFSMRPSDSLGKVAILQARDDPRQPWTVREIDRLPTSHRLRWAAIEGKQPGVLINAPLAGPLAEPPDYKAPVPLVFYRPGAWKRELISEELQGVLHGIAVADFDGDGREEVLTASFRGLDLFKLEAGNWRRSHLADGNPQPWPRSGASEISVGKLWRTRFLASVEPWHGNQVVVYLPAGQGWRRLVIDDSLVEAHALETADFNADGRDEILAGFRGKGRSVYIYYAEDATGERWRRQILDAGEMAASSCVVADFNLDRRPDVACIGAATANLKWYENLGWPRRRSGRF